MRDNNYKHLGYIHDEVYIDCVIKLRYGNVIYTEQVKPVLNYKTIALLLKRSSSTVRSHRLKVVELKYQQLNSKPKRNSEFLQKHIDYLINEKNFEVLGSLLSQPTNQYVSPPVHSIENLCIVFANIYKRNGISYKGVNRIKRVIDFTLTFHNNILNYICNQMQRAQQNNIKFIHAEEAVFTFNTFIQKFLNKRHSNIEVYDKKVKVQTMVILGGISEDASLETYVIHPRSIKTEQYIKFLEQLKEKCPKKNYTVC